MSEPEPASTREHARGGASAEIEHLRSSEPDPHLSTTGRRFAAGAWTDRPAPCFLLQPTEATAELYATMGTPGGPRGDSGVDLRWATDVEFPSSEDADGFPTVVSLEVRVRCVGVDGDYVPYEIAPRSSIGKTPLGLANSIGIVDKGYTGPLKVAVRNHSRHEFDVRRGESHFQLVLPGLEPARVVVVGPDHGAFAAGATARGDGGFGSTGVGGAGARGPAPKESGPESGPASPLKS